MRIDRPKARVGSTQSVTVDATSNTTELKEIIERIQERDQQLEIYARSNWLCTGRDLLRAKIIVGHGNFGDWCEENLGYSKSKAEKLMRAAVVLGPYLESVPVTDLPPRTLADTLSGRFVPNEIRDTFMPRIIAGDDVGREVRIAVRNHRERTKQAKQMADPAAATLPCQASDEVAQDREAEARAAEELQHSVAKSEAVALIVDRFDGDLSALIALLDRAGPGAVFVSAAERILRDHAPS